MYKLKLNDKYEIIENLSSTPPEFKCLRFGEEWRDLIGDNMVLSLVFKIKELEEQLKK